MPGSRCPLYGRPSQRGARPPPQYSVRSSQPSIVGDHTSSATAEYALASKIAHPRNVFVHEDEILPELDAWLVGQFAPGRIEEVIEATGQKHGCCRGTR
jgi:hypothetical protein